MPENTKIITYAELTRLNSTREAIEEQESIDPGSLRQVDYAEKHFGTNPYAKKSFHTLNLYSVGNDNFINGLEEYLKENNYQYLLISQEQTPNLSYLPIFKKIAENSKLIIKFEDKAKLQPNSTIIHHLTIDNFQTLQNLFQLKFGGQAVALYELQ